MKINVSRFIREKENFQVEVLTPMFLGGSSGDAELRAAPFKSALRYWWRITQGDIKPEELREKEQKLFGGVTDKANRSLVDVVTTGHVITGEINERDIIGNKINPEAHNQNVPLSAYLGMGPVNFNGRYTKKRILPAETFRLSIAFPREHSTNMLETLSLFNSFGGLGARSRNGWGSFSLRVETGSFQLLSRAELFSRFGSEMERIFNNNKKYPFQLGKVENRPLLWEIGTAARWQDVMNQAAERYMDLRQQAFPFPMGRPNGVQNRHILGYPITNHILSEWGGRNGRMPSQLRILVRKQNGDQYTSYFFHLPHKIPKPWNNNLGSELSVWETIHQYLDNHCTRAI